MNKTCKQLIVTSLTNMADWNRGIAFRHVFTSKYSAINRLRRTRANVTPVRRSVWPD